MNGGSLLVSLLASLLGQKHTVDVGQNTTGSNGHTAKQLAQLLIISDCKLNVAGDNTSLLVVTGCVTSQLENLSSKVLKDSGLQRDAFKSAVTKVVQMSDVTYQTKSVRKAYQVHWSASTNAGCVLALLQVPGNSSHWELQTSLAGSRNLFLACRSFSFAASRHDCR